MQPPKREDGVCQKSFNWSFLIYKKEIDASNVCMNVCIKVWMASIVSSLAVHSASSSPPLA